MHVAWCDYGGSDHIGCSGIFGPDGTILAGGDIDDDIKSVIGKIDLDEDGKDDEQKNNYLRDRRPELYHQILDSQMS